MALGNPYQYVFFYVSTLMSGLYIGEDGKDFDKEKSSTYEEIEKMYREEVDQYVFSSRDSLTLSCKSGNYKFEEFDFFLLPKAMESNYIYSGCLGLEYTPIKTEKKYSFLENLFDLKYISYKVFFLTRTELSGTLTFGIFPDDYTNKKKFKTCSLVSERGKPNQFWQCRLNSVFLNGENPQMLPVNADISFSLTGNMFSVSNELFSKMKEEYFSAPIREGVCRCVFDRKVYFDCNKEFKFDDKEQIGFIFGKWSIKFKLNDLFNKQHQRETKWFGLVFSEEGMGWTFGLRYFKNHILSFDKEHNKFGVSKLS